MKRFLVCVVLAALAAGCALQGSTATPASHSPRSRCLAHPGETGGTRPLIFLFCAESP